MRKFRMIPKELDHEDGELTATQKVKRSSLQDMFGHLLEDMYGNRTEFAGGDLVEVHTSRDFREGGDPEATAAAAAGED
jgi:long-chain acyl-CoA synthetase